VRKAFSIRDELKTIAHFNISDKDKFYLTRKRIKEVLYGLNHGIHPDKAIPYEIRKDKA